VQLVVVLVDVVVVVVGVGVGVFGGTCFCGGGGVPENFLLLLFLTFVSYVCFLRYSVFVEMQKEHLLMIEELEKTEVSEREEEELKKQEMVDDLKMKEEQWSAIKQILTDFPKIQAEADQLKKEGTIILVKVVVVVVRFLTFDVAVCLFVCLFVLFVQWKRLKRKEASWRER
jgi:membrane protein implicated in regulation of membrane protease activity